MLQAVEAFYSGDVAGEDPQTHVRELYDYAEGRGKRALRTALEQRYEGLG